jgi:hypothetical protein
MAVKDPLLSYWNKYKYTDLFNNPGVTTPMSTLVEEQLIGLKPDIVQNYNSLLSKFPNQSKDYLLSAAKIGLNANSQGIEKLSAHDGIAQLKQDLINFDNIKSEAEKNKGFRESLYGVLKGTTRVGFAALQAPYQYVTNVGRNIYARSKGEISTSQLISNASLSELVGEETNLGQLMRATTGAVTGKGPIDTGSGFFVAPESKVGAAQAKAMSAYGRVNGKSFTLGRSTMNSLGADPNSTPYRVMSGIIDATLAVGTDPSLWVGPGSVTKIIQGGKEAIAMKETAKRIQDAGNLAKIEDIKQLTKQADKQSKQFAGEQKKIIRRIDNTYLKAERELAKTQQSKSNAITKKLEKALTAGFSRGTKIEGDPEVVAAIADGSIGDFVTAELAAKKPKGVIDSIAQLEADQINTGEAFVGIFTEDLPQPGKLQFGAYTDKEYILTASGKQPLDVYDISKTYKGATQDEIIEESARRANFWDELQTELRNPNITDDLKKSLNAYVTKGAEGKLGPKASMDDILSNAGVESVASLMARALATKNEELIITVSNAIENSWVADAYSNVRAIHGGMGGVVIKNGEKVGARRVGVTDTITSLSGDVAMSSKLGAKLVESIKDAQQEILEASTAFENAKTARAGIDGKLKQIEVLRDYLAQDPDSLKQILNDPENIGIAKLMDLEMEIADTNYLKEFYRSEVGLIDGFGGAVKGDVDKAATYLLGKNFEAIAEIVAKEKDFSRLHSLFGRKLDVEMTKELVAATTPDQVISVFLKNLAAPTSDPKIYRSLALRAEAAGMSKNPLFKVVPPVPKGAIDYVQKVERNFGRYFTRSVILPLDDVDRLVNGMEDWMSSAKIPDDIISSTINKIVKATSVQERSGIVFREIETVQLALAERLAPGDKDLLASIKQIYRASAKDSALIKEYSVIKTADNAVPTWNLFGGKKLPIGKDVAMLEHQFLDDVIKLPNTEDIVKLINKYNKTKAIGKTKDAIAVFNTEFGERWRTAQLAFRIAYIMRNIGEMQFRQYFSGHDSLFNHPLGYISMIMANPNGGPAKRFLAQIAKYQNDVLGNKLIKLDKDADAAVSPFVEGHMDMMSRNTYSGDARFSYVENIWEKVGPESDKYHRGLANTIIRWRSDELIPLVANTIEGTEDQVVQLILDQKLPVLEAMIQGGRYGVEGNIFAQGLLKDLTRNADGRFKVTADNIQFENLKSYLFDRSPDSFSVIKQIDGLAGVGPNSNAIRKMLADEFATINGKTIKIPGYKELDNINSLPDQENAFTSFLYRNFKSEDMTGSTALTSRSEKVGLKQFGFFNKAVEGFFDLSTKIENVVNFSPEFRMSYWDHVGRYVGMVNDDALQELLVNAQKSLAPLTMNGRSISLRRHPSLRAINKEIAARKKGKSVADGIDLHTMNEMASSKASEYTKNLFYDAAKQRQHAAALRTVFPFIQAQFNTIYKWGELFTKQPVQFYKLGRAYNSLTQKDTSAIYDLTGIEYDENQGFFYKDEFGETRFRYPLAGSIIGALAGKNIDTAQALQITAPVQSLNLVFGAVNPAVPGIGPVGQVLYSATGKSKAFGPEWDSISSIIFPFGEPEGVEDLVLPAWLKKSFLLSINNDKQVERGVKDWAGYLASTGKYGENPLANDAERNQLFNDARGLSRWTSLMTAFFQSIAPATPSQEVFAKDKNGTLRTQTFLYNAYEQISKKYPGDYFAAIGEFSDTFGIKNLLPILAGSTRSVRGTGDAWSFLNKYPNVADTYATKSGDIVPYFFPGGEAATAYYNWQKATGRRRTLRPEELEQYAENIVYSMAKSQISEEQADMGYSDVWYTQEIIKLNDQFGGSAPVMSVDIGSAEDKIANVGKALQDPAFQESPIYKETAQFYAAYDEFKKFLQEVRTSATPAMGGGNWYARERSKQLEILATQLMVNNPAFARMYYGVFASKLKVEE